MTHHIKHPENYPLVEELHDYLWKTFPMDRFEFIASSGERGPVYSGTTLPIDPIFTVIRGEAPKVAFFDEFNEAVQSFVCGLPADVPAEEEAEQSIERRIA